MGKHEAPSPAKNRSSSAPKHAAQPSEQGGFRLNLSQIKLPELKKPEIKLPKLREISLPRLGLLKETEDGEFDRNEPENEDEDVKVYTGKRPEAESEPEPEAEDKSGEEKAEVPAEELLKTPAEEPLEQPDFTGISVFPKKSSAETEEEEESEEEDELPDRGLNFKMPKVDLTKVRGFFEKLVEVGSDGESAGTHRKSVSFSRNEILITAGSALLFFLLWMLPTRGALRFILYIVPLLVIGLNTCLDAVGEILDGIIPGRNLLISVAAIGLLIIGLPRAAFFVMLMHRVFLLIEAYLFEKKAACFDELDALIPKTAVKETEEGLQKVDPREMSAGDTLFVPAGELVALDGVVIEGISSLDCAVLCGEGSALDVGVNSRVYAGCRNLTNPLRIRVTGKYSETTVYRFVERVKNSAETVPARTALPQKILNWVPTVLAVLGLAVGVIAAIVTGAWKVWLGRGLLMIAVAACGDALLSARMAYFGGVIDAAHEGLSFRNADAVDRFAGSDMMIFSKTGSVTEGKYSVVAVYPVEYEEKDLLTIAALAECQSMHPIAVALRDACGLDVHHRSDITLLEETPGRGIHTLFNGRNVYVGNSTLLLDHNIVFDVPSHKGTVIHVAVDNKYAGCIVLNDRIREGAFDAVEELRLRGIRAAVMLTGDVRSMARPIASSLGFDMVKCELSNESKLDALAYLRESKGNSAAISYVSSKDEDVELLSAADVGVGFAALTQDKLLDSASVLVMGSKIFQIPQAMFLAKRISFAALLSAAVMLGLELLLLILGLCGVVSAWAALLFVLLARVATLIYAIYFR